MKSIAVKVPTDIENVIKKHSEVNWKEVAKRAISSLAIKLNMLDKIASKSKLIEKDIDILDHAIKSTILKRYKEGWVETCYWYEYSNFMST